MQETYAYTCVDIMNYILTGIYTYYIMNYILIFSPGAPVIVSLVHKSSLTCIIMNLSYCSSHQCSLLNFM